MRATQHSASRLAVGLYRVSAAEQGQSGLGLETQQASARLRGGPGLHPGGQALRY
ncbi:hypothetical protein ACLF3G_24040 [Falsiroseomonas sp. HC035]|uniref:hypothetical protein n=1 Tax=Falsiroseomonas sp. HC035 TaxID=3390999 RepID=UPI003D316B87